MQLSLCFLFSCFLEYWASNNFKAPCTDDVASLNSPMKMVLGLLILKLIIYAVLISKELVSALKTVIVKNLQTQTYRAILMTRKTINSSCITS